GAGFAQELRVLPRDDLRGRRGDAGVDPRGEHRAVLLRHAEQQADRLQRQVAREALDEIERLVLGQRVDQRDGAAAQLRLERVDRAVGETLVDQAAQTLMARVVAPIEKLSGLPLVIQPSAAADAAAAL